MMIKGLFVVVVVVGLFMVVVLVVVLVKEVVVKVYCGGVNVCKGKGGCKGVDNVCKG